MTSKHKCRAIHLHFGENSGYPRSGWWCANCGRAMVQGHPPLKGKELREIRVVVEALGRYGKAEKQRKSS